MRIGKAGAFRHRLRTYVESVSDIFNRVMSLAEVFMKRKAILFLIVLTALALTGIVTACSLHEHTLERVKAVAPTCDMDGNSEYWRCTGCGKLFKDESASVEIADESSFSIAAKGHDLIQVEENPATCTNNGTRSYWICRTCGKMFGDAEGEHGLSEEDIVLTFFTIIPRSPKPVPKTEISSTGRAIIAARYSLTPTRPNRRTGSRMLR